uniref:Suf domain-containing protein n=1 Tax=Syphacia muris TaxID=451379 RepID=A0A0N5AIR5_9BILA
MSSLSIVSPERRIELNPFDVDAWNLLLRESQARSIDQVRPFYEKLVAQFPNAGRYWKAYIDHEVKIRTVVCSVFSNIIGYTFLHNYMLYFFQLRGKNYENVEALFGRCLIHVLNIDLWKCYVFYVRETKGHLSSFREKMAQAYEFALEKVGMDMHSYSIYADYISFLKSAPTVGQYAENQRISAVRKIYQRGVVTPMINIEQLWAEYCAYEKSVNATLAERLMAERNKEYQVAKRISKALEQVTRGLNRQAVSVPPRGTAAEMKQLEMWRKYIQWEKSNPSETEEYAQFAKRVIFAYEQALLCLGYYPDIWYEASLFQQKAAAVLTEKGDVKTANAMNAEISQLFERAIGGLLKTSQLLFFAYADFEEERMKYDNVKKIYDRYLAIEECDPTLAYIQLMKFVRRTEGVQFARSVFKRARQDPRCKFHVYVASALMEYYCSKDTDIAIRIFDMGLKKYGDEPDYALAYVDFLSHLNEDNNTRVVFERILTSGTMPTEKSLEIWDRYLDFESQVGDLASVLKVDQRRRDALKESYGEMQTLLLIDRYRFLNLVPCTNEQLRLMGYSVSTFGVSACPSTTKTISGGAQGPSTVMGGGVILEISGYPRPDTDQMIPFKPKLNCTASFHPILGGVFPPPPAAAQLMQILPPPHCFNGPFVSVDLLMESLRKFSQREPPTVNPNVKLENGTMFGIHRIEDIKKEFYQLVATTTDPNVVSKISLRVIFLYYFIIVLSSSEYQQQQSLIAARKRKAAGDSDSDEEAPRGSTGIFRDIYKRRMNMKVHE